MISFGIRKLVYTYKRESLKSQSMIYLVFPNVDSAEIKVLCSALSYRYAQSTKWFWK